MNNLLLEGMNSVVLPTGISRKLTLDGETKVCPVYRVRLDCLYYNDQNDRIASWISQYTSRHGSGAFSVLERDEYNKIIEDFIIQSNPAAIDRTQMNIELVGQREPGVVLADGRLIDGNRRFTCLRRLAEKEERFNWFETVILQSSLENDRKQIKMLELSIQHGEEKKVDYNPLDRLVGVYQDIVESEMLTVEEYARSTNETVFEVRKRVANAKLLVEFLEYIGMPKQYYVAREYQVVSVLSDLSDLLKKFPEPEKQRQVKEAVFLNIMMKTVGDGRKYIQSLQSMLINGLLPAYLKEQQRLGEQARERLRATRPDSKPMLDRFVRENEQITEDLQLSMDKSLLKARRSETRSKPSRIVTKSITMLKDVDTRILEKLNDGERDKLREQMNRLSQMVSSFDALIGSDSTEKPAPAPKTSVDDTDLFDAPPTQKRYFIAPLKLGMPFPQCEDAGKTLSSLSFSLRFTGRGGREGQSAEYLLFFVDEKQRRASENVRLRIAEGETVQCPFLLDARMSAATQCCLAVQEAEGADDALQLLLPFSIQMSFTTDFGF